MLHRITDEISLIKVKFHNVFTSVFLVKLDMGYAIFDSATTERDVNDTIMPAILMAGIKPAMVRFIFVSHTHGDHFGGTAALLSALPCARLVIFDTARAIREGFSDRLFDGEASEYSPLVTIPLTGHDPHCLALLDPRTRTLLSGDAVQLYGLSRWGTGVFDVEGYFKILDTLSAMDIELLVASHEYYPLGQTAIGKREVRRYLSASAEALYDIISLVSDSDESPERVAASITAQKRVSESSFPDQQMGTVRAVREYLKQKNETGS